MVKIGEFRDVLDEATQKARCASDELSALRHGPSVDEQYKLDWAALTRDDLKRLWDSADTLNMAVAELSEKIRRSRL